MRLAAKIKRIFANLIARDRLETTLDAELRVFLDEMTERKIRQGVPPSEARRQVLLEAEGVEFGLGGTVDLQRYRWRPALKKAAAD